MAGKDDCDFYVGFNSYACLVYQTFIGAMNEKIRRQISISNPFVFKHISNLKVRRLLTWVNVDCALL